MSNREPIYELVKVQPMARDRDLERIEKTKEDMEAAAQPGVFYEIRTVQEVTRPFRVVSNE